jgi:hypothetical protein
MGTGAKVKPRLRFDPEARPRLLKRTSAPAGSHSIADADFLLSWARDSIPVNRGSCPEDSGDFSSRAACASDGIPGRDRRRMVVAGHTDQFSARTDRSESQTSMRILRPLSEPPDIAVAGDAGVAGTD